MIRPHPNARLSQEPGSPPAGNSLLAGGATDLCDTDVGQRCPAKGVYPYKRDLKNIEFHLDVVS